MEDLSYINKNIDTIKKKVEAAANKSGRKFSDITILAVTKTVSTEKMKVAIEAGFENLAENKVQEILWKYDELGDKYNWHLIGHLQTNKVKSIVDKVMMIHSVDSQRLAKEINDRAQKINRVIDILIEVNIADESSKFGVKPQELATLLEEIGLYSYVKVEGLMTIAPNVENPEENRKYFKEMYKLFIDISDKKIDNIDMKYLSMGMTKDYEVAVEEGANIIRIGTGIFGERYYI
jgi:pyridoxal phosphate enzyme (YggS family)